MCQHDSHVNDFRAIIDFGNQAIFVAPDVKYSAGADRIGVRKIRPGFSQIIPLGMVGDLPPILQRLARIRMFFPKFPQWSFANDIGSRLLMRVGERRAHELNRRRSTDCEPLMFFVSAGNSLVTDATHAVIAIFWKCRLRLYGLGLIGILDGPVFDFQTGNLSEIGAIARDDDCAIGYGDGGYSQVLAADAKPPLLQIFKNGNDCSIKFENAQLRRKRRSARADLAGLGSIQRSQCSR